MVKKKSKKKNKFHMPDHRIKGGGDMNLLGCALIVGMILVIIIATLID